MKLSVGRLVVLLLLILAVGAGWSARPADPANAGRDGTIVAFEEHALTGEYAGDIDIGAQRLSDDGTMTWNEGKKSAVVSSGKTLERAAVAVPDGVGGLIVAFEMEAASGEGAGDSDIYAQRIDADGNMLWNNGEKSTVVAASKWSEKRPVIVPDGKGGAIIIFEEYAPAGEYAGDIDVGAQRISPDGKLLWNGGEKSATVASSKLLERASAAIPDGLGGVIVAFEVEARTGEEVGDSDIYAQRLDADGKMVWNGGEKSSTVAASKWSEKRPVVISDGARGAIVVFEEHGPAGKFAGDLDVGAQRISSDGKMMWNDGQKSASVADSDTLLERAPAALPDGDGGVIVAFEQETRTGEEVGDSDIYAQRLDANGKRMWNNGEKSSPVAASKWSEKRPVVISDGAGGAIVAFEEHGPAGKFAGDIDVGIQRISAGGKMLWNEGQKSASVADSDTLLERAPTAIPDGAGGAVVAFEQEERTGENAGDSEIFAQRIDSSGKRMWNNGERSSMVAASKWSETNPVAVRP